MKYKPKVIETTDPFFKLFQKIIKETIYPEKIKIIKVNVQFKTKIIPKHFKFEFQWQNDEICGVDVYEEIIAENTKKDKKLPMKQVSIDYKYDVSDAIRKCVWHTVRDGVSNAVSVSVHDANVRYAVWDAVFEFRRELII